MNRAAYIAFLTDRIEDAIKTLLACEAMRDALMEDPGGEEPTEEPEPQPEEPGGETGGEQEQPPTEEPDGDEDTQTGGEAPGGGEDTQSGGGGPTTPPVVGNYNPKTASEFVDAVTSAPAGADIVVKGDIAKVSLSGIKKTVPVTIHGSGTIMEGIDLTGCSGLIFRGLKFMPKGQVVHSGKGALPYMLTGDKTCSDIEIHDSDFWGAADAPNFMVWDKAKWLNQQVSAVLMRGTRITARGNAVVGCHFAYNFTGNDVDLFDNRACGLSADGFRIGADGGNRVRNRLGWVTDMFVINANHPDLIQAFNLNSPMSDHLHEDCILLEHSGATDMRNPQVAASAQVVGYHQGGCSNLVVRRVVGASSSLNAYHVEAPAHTADHVAMFAQPGPKGGITKFRAPAATSINEVYCDKTTGTPITGKPDYAKLPAFLVPALRGNPMPALRAIMGW